MNRLRARIAREESGFTLIELLVSAVIGTVIIGVAFGLLDSSVRAFGSSEARTDASQRGRLALDVVAQELRSPVCIQPAANDAAFVTATPTTAKFMSDLSGGVRAPLERELSYSAGTLTENTRNVTTGATTTRELITGIAPVDATTPVFSYFALTPVSPTGRQATVALGAGSSVGAADLKRITRIHVAFKVVPKSADDVKSSVEFVNDVYVRAIDASSEDGSINCVGTP
jgi:prepilin-type N-terminal cleavage/methylation domain-containing protein